MIRSLRPAAAGLALLVSLSVPASGVRLAGQTPTGVVAIRNATLLTVTKGTIAAGTIVLQNGKIKASQSFSI